MATPWFFRGEVGEPDTAGSSTSFLVVVTTNLFWYSEHGAPVDATQAAAREEEEEEEETEKPGDDDDDLAELVAKLKLIPERRIAVRRTYSEFVKLRESLEKTGLPGADKLPALPAKRLFGSQDAKVIQERMAAFNALFAHLSQFDGLASADETCAFLCAVARPDFEKVHAEARKRMAEVLGLPEDGWDVRYDKRDIVIAVQKLEGSHFYLVKSTMLIPLPTDKVLKHYRHTANWKQWMADATFREVERLGADAAVMLVSYKLPVITNRDVLLYEATTPGLPSDPAAAGCHTLFACSIDHPECPKRRGWVRAQLGVSVTVFEPAEGGQTRMTSIQHSDPRGKVPPNVVNQMLVRGKEQLKTMRQVMVEKLK